MLFGLEKECLVFDKDFKPYVLDENIFDENTELDFCDHQIELISNVCSSIEQLHTTMNDLALAKYPQDGQIWPISPINCCLDYSLVHPKLTNKEYHHYLADKYDIKMLLTSGIHFNVSGFKSDLVDMAKKLYVVAPLVLPFFSFSPIKEDTNIISSRNTNQYGYYNEQDFELDFSSIDSYYASIDKLINEGKISANRELYSRIRIKNSQYLELRFIDLNPNYLIGISYEQLKLLEILIRYLDNQEITSFDYKQNVGNFDYVASNGSNLDINLTINGKEDSLYNHMIKLLNALREYDHHIIDMFINQLENNNTDSINFYQDIKDNYDFTICSYGKSHMFTFANFIDPYPDLKMELSTKILMNSANKLDKQVEVLSEHSNVITIDNNLVVQATKTNLDGYANIEILENKNLTKLFLNKYNIKTPSSILINPNSKLELDMFNNKKIVIKPIDTNFGEGITILESNHNPKQLQQAIDYAFSFSKEVLIEEFVSGKEYRFLVIDNKCRSIIHRVACNVVGDGIHSIKELIDIKNQNPLRGYKYNKPLEKIIVDDAMLDILKEQGLTLDSVVSNNTRVFLRKTSNVSTGGDTYEMSDYIPDFFKKEAEKAAKALDVKICGIDMIIEVIYSYEYGIIEANFNPAIHMHAYPLVGVSKDVTYDIINLLDKNN